MSVSQEGGVAWLPLVPPPFPNLWRAQAQEGSLIQRFSSKSISGLRLEEMLDLARGLVLISTSWGFFCPLWIEISNWQSAASPKLAALGFGHCRPSALRGTTLAMASHKLYHSQKCRCLCGFSSPSGNFTASQGLCGCCPQASDSFSSFPSGPRHLCHPVSGLSLSQLLLWLWLVASAPALPLALSLYGGLSLLVSESLRG